MAQNNKQTLSKAEAEKILKENRRLKKENESMNKILNSKRFRFAEKIANTYNALIPDGTVRRRVVRGLLAPSNRMRIYKQRKIIRRAKRAIGRNKKVLVIHSIPWNTPLRQRPHHLAKCLSEYNDVLVVYFEPDEPMHSLRKINKNLITTNSWEVIFSIVENNHNKYYFFFNNVSNIPFKTVKKLKSSGYRIVYEYIDEFHEDISGSLMNQLEVWDRLPKLKPNLVLASAKKLFVEAVKQFGRKNVILSKNAVNIEDFDYHNFQMVEAPADLKSILKLNKPIVGYYGAVAPWLDYGLITETVKNNKNLEFVFLGVNYQNALKKLDLSQKNIHYLGPKNYNDLPKYSRYFDCAIIPFKKGEIAKGTSPVKLFEYMAMGLSTVGTRDLEECKGYDYVYLARNSGEFSEMVKKAIREGKNQKNKEVLLAQAKQNSWMIRAEDIIKKLK